MRELSRVRRAAGLRMKCPKGTGRGCRSSARPVTRGYGFPSNPSAKITSENAVAVNSVVAVAGSSEPVPE